MTFYEKAGDRGALDRLREGPWPAWMSVQDVSRSNLKLGLGEHLFIFDVIPAGPVSRGRQGDPPALRVVVRVTPRSPLALVREDVAHSVQSEYATSLIAEGMEIKDAYERAAWVYPIGRCLA